MTERKFKVILMGDSCAGKTSLVTRYIKNEFFDDHFPTLGDSVYTPAVIIFFPDPFGDNPLNVFYYFPDCYSSCPSPKLLCV